MGNPTASATLSLCMIVKNEAQNLERCLASVKEVADEVIVVDTGSTDRTVEMAEAHGARVCRHEWRGDFSLARNQGLAQATGAWILHLDADEELAPESRLVLKSVLAGAEVDGLHVCVRNFNAPGGLTAYFDSQQVRLFRNRPHIRYEQPIHELIAPSVWRHGGRVGDSDLMIWHYGYMASTVQGEADRARRNLAILEQAVAEAPQDAGHCARLGFSYYQLGQPALAYAYLRRALVELDSSRMTPEFLERVLCTLWEVAAAQQDIGLARHCARALLALRDGLALSFNATCVLANTCLQEGEQGLEIALSENRGLVEARARLEAAHQALQQAGHYFVHLKHLPEASPAGIELAENGWRRSQAGVAAAASYLELSRRQLAAEETLRRLLEADDPGQMIQGAPGLASLEAAALARTKAKATRAEGREAEAARLEVLAQHLETAWRLKLERRADSA